MLIELPRIPLDDIALLIQPDKGWGICAEIVDDRFDYYGYYLSLEGDGALWRLTVNDDETEFHRSLVPVPDHSDEPDTVQSRPWWYWHSIEDGTYCATFVVGIAVQECYFTIHDRCLWSLEDNDLFLRELYLVPTSLLDSN